MIDDNKMFGISMLLLGLITIFVSIVAYINIEYGIMCAVILVAAIFSIIGVIVIYFNRDDKAGLPSAGQR